MKWIDTINRFLATSIGLLNAVLAIFLILFTTALSIEWIGGFGIFIGPILGAAFAVVFCGVLALLISIRDLLAALLDQRDAQNPPASLDDPPADN